MYKKIRRFLRQWWECRTEQCTYFRHYLAYGPAELTHKGYHAAEDLASKHFANCHWQSEGLCPTCSSWERRVRA